MKKASLLVAALMCLSTPWAYAADTGASEASVRRLIAVTESKRLLDGALANMNEAMKSSAQQALGGQSVTPEQQAALSEMQDKIAALLKEEMAWEQLEPTFIEIYRKNFTQKEVDGMLAFYNSPAGQAVIRKMPQVMQGTMQMMQARMAGIMPKIVQLSTETAEKLQQAGEKH